MWSFFGKIFGKILGKIFWPCELNPWREITQPRTSLFEELESSGYEATISIICMRRVNEGWNNNFMSKLSMILKYNYISYESPQLQWSSKLCNIICFVISLKSALVLGPFPQKQEWESQFLKRNRFIYFIKTAN